MKKVQIGSNPWTICNTNNSFYSSDTLVLLNGSDIKDCCESINWTFYRKNAFVLSKSNSCQEPPVSEAKTYWFSLEIIMYEQNVFLNVINEKGTIDRFKVISFEEQKGRKSLILFRTLH